MPGLPGPVIRLIALIFGPGYVWILAVILTRSTGKPLALTIIAVALGGIALTLLTSNLVAVLYESEHQRHRWSISTFMQITAVLAIYFAYIGQFISPVADQPITWDAVSTVFFYSAFFIGITTIVIVTFADSLVTFLHPLVGIIKTMFKRKT